MKKNSLKSLIKEVNIIQNITFTLAIINILLLIGTAGALECEVIGFGRAILQSIILAATMWLLVKYVEHLDIYMKIIKNQMRKENEEAEREKAIIAHNRAQIIEFLNQNWNDCGQINPA